MKEDVREWMCAMLFYAHFRILPGIDRRTLAVYT